MSGNRIFIGVVILITIILVVLVYIVGCGQISTFEPRKQITPEAVLIERIEIGIGN